MVKGSVVSSAYTVNQQESFLFVIDLEFISTIIFQDKIENFELPTRPQIEAP